MPEIRWMATDHEFSNETEEIVEEPGVIITTRPQLIVAEKELVTVSTIYTRLSKKLCPQVFGLVWHVQLPY